MTMFFINFYLFYSNKEIGYFVFHQFQWDLFLGLSGMQGCNQCESIFNDNIHFDNHITNF